MAAKADGTVYSWGYNGDGQLGDGTTTSHTSPVQTGSSSLGSVRSVAAGTYHGLAVKTDGTVWGWGGSYDGQVGNGSTGNVWSPAQASSLSGMGGVAAGAWHSLAAYTRRATTTYGYDALYRLTSERAPGLLTTYAYDPVGNRTGVTRGGSTSSHTYDKLDRVPVAESFVYDANGNLTLAPPNSFGYDDANRLVSTGGSPAAATYTLDGDGLQVARDVSGTPATNHFKYVYDRNRSLPVVLQDQVETIFGGSTTVTHKYVWGATGLAYVAGSDGSLAVYHADGLGSVRALTDGSGVVTQVYRTDAYGVPPDTSEPSNPPDQPFRFAGEAKDYAAAGSGLVNLRARFYAPDLGRFLQRDPHAGSPADPQSLNRYSYVQNNPVNLTDPSGLAPAKSMNLTNCITFTPLFGPPIQLCFPSTGGGQGAGQTQTQLPPCPTGYGAGNPTDTGTLSRADYQYASGPEKSGGGRYACHVNTRAGNLNRHITYNQATKEFQSDLPSTPLGGNPATAALIIAIQEGYYLATTNKLPGGLPNLGGYPAYRDWYLAPPPGGNLADRLTQLVGYAP